MSDKLHRRSYSRILRIWVGLLVGIALTAFGAALLLWGLDRASPAGLLAAAVILMTTLQPLVKVAAGVCLGVRYSYVWFWGFEPRFKMRYGTYLAAPRWRRVMVHLAGTLGSPLALLCVALLAAPVQPSVASLCWALFGILLVPQVVPFLLVLLGVGSLGRLRLASRTSGGAAADELRSATP